MADIILPISVEKGTNIKKVKKNNTKNVFRKIRKS